jgi:hypothetical protein
MEWLGELERTFATSLYPLRVPIAIGVATALVGLVVVARRRRWLASAQRHRVRSAALGLALLAVGGPAGWYLGSPLFIRTSLLEPAPVIGGVAAGTPLASAIPRASHEMGEAAMPPAAPAPRLAPIRAGSFRGADDFHFGSGEARLIETGPGAWVVRFEDFSVRNGPDLFVYLSPDPGGYADGVVELGRLKATDGSFNMKVPPGSNVDEMRSVVIWCRQFAVQFAVAKLR